MPFPPNEVESVDMTFWKTNQKIKQTRWTQEAVIQRLRLAVIKSDWWQLSIAALVGLLLAIFLLFAISWKPRWAPFIALAALFPFVAMIFGDIRRLLLAIILIETPFHLDINYYYDYWAVSVNAIGGFNISITTFCLGALYALWWVELLTQKTPTPNVLRQNLPLLAYLAAVVLSMLVAQNDLLASFEVFLLFQTFLLVLYLVRFIRSRQDIQLLITMLLIGLVLESLVMIGLRILGHSISIAGIKASIDGGRVSGTLGSPNTAAGYLELLLAPAMGVLLTPLPKRYKLLAGLAFSLGAVAMLLTFSRGGWVAFIVSITLLLSVAFYRGWLSPKLPLTIIAILVPVLFVFRQPILDRLQGDDLGAADSRTIMYRQALRVIEANPVLGVGANNYANWYEQHPEPEIDAPRLRTAHNKYLLVWAETGIIGLAAFLGFLFSVIKSGWEIGSLNDRLMSPLAIGFTVAIVGQMAHMFFDIFHSRPQVQTLWIVAALVIGMRNLVISTK